MEAIDGELMTPDEVLHWLERLCIRYKVHKGAFVTDQSIMLTDGKQCLPNLKRSIEAHADALADLCQTRTPDYCHWCKLVLRPGAPYIRVYAQEEGRRFAFHEKCYADRAEKLPNLPTPEILIDEPGYTVLIEDSGLCCYCQMAEAEYPEETPNVCRRCWKIRQAKNKAARLADGAEMDRSNSAAHGA